jgi:phage tail sheath gpL-like
MTVGTFNATATYSAGATGATAAEAVAAALNVSGSPVTATANGDVVTLASVAAGSTGNLALQTKGDANFELTASGATMTGGRNAISNRKFDAGSVEVTTNGVTASAIWGRRSTPATIAKALAASINKVASAYWKATASGDVVTLTSVSTASAKASAAVRAVSSSSIGVSVTDSEGFAPPSFGAKTN